MESCFTKCSCGAVLPTYKMQSANNEMVCNKCFKLAKTKQKRRARKSEEYQAIVVLLDGTRLFYKVEVNA